MDRITTRKAVYCTWTEEVLFNILKNHSVCRAFCKLQRLENLEEDLEEAYGTENHKLLDTVVSSLVYSIKTLQEGKPVKSILLTDAQVDNYMQWKALYEKDILPVLPCSVGDIVYDVVLCDDAQYHVFKMKVCNINPFGDVRKGKVWNVYLEDECTKAYRSFYDFGQTVFHSEEEANAKKKELDDENLRIATSALKDIIM